MLDVSIGLLHRQSFPACVLSIIPLTNLHYVNFKGHSRYDTLSFFIAKQPFIVCHTDYNIHPSSYSFSLRSNLLLSTILITIFTNHPLYSLLPNTCHTHRLHPPLTVPIAPRGRPDRAYHNSNPQFPLSAPDMVFHVYFPCNFFGDFPLSPSQINTTIFPIIIPTPNSNTFETY